MTKSLSRKAMISFASLNLKIDNIASLLLAFDFSISEVILVLLNSAFNYNTFKVKATSAKNFKRRGLLIAFRAATGCVAGPE